MKRPGFDFQHKSSKKRLREDSDEDNAKKQKLEDDAEKKELRDSMDVVPRDDIAIDVESLATKYLIVDWKIHVLIENIMYYQIIRGDRSSKNYKIFREMLDDFDRQDVLDLHRLVQERYGYQEKNKNKDKTGQSRAREWNEREKMSLTVLLDLIGPAR
ncbi:hypothetical protein Tco_0184933, partial [Tanacetum coccineum]